MIVEGGTVNVVIGEKGGITPEEYARMCVGKMIHIGENAHPALQAQATAYKDRIEKLVADYMHKAVKSDRTTIYRALVDAGHPDLAKAIMEL